MTVCLAVCCLFASCATQIGTYIGTRGDSSIELKLKLGNELSLKIDETTIEGNWELEQTEEGETIVVLKIGDDEYKATYNDSNASLTMPIILDLTNLSLSAISGVTLVKK